MADTPKNSPSSVLEQFKEMQDGALSAPTLSPQEVMAGIIAQARQEKKTGELLQKFQPILIVFNEYAMSRIAHPNRDFDLDGTASIRTDISDAVDGKGPVRIKIEFSWNRVDKSDESDESDKSEENPILDEITVTPVEEGFDVTVKRTVSLNPRAKALEIRDLHSFEESRRCATFGEMDHFLSSRLLFSTPPKSV